MDKGKRTDKRRGKQALSVLVSLCMTLSLSGGLLVPQAFAAEGAQAATAGSEANDEPVAMDVDAAAVDAENVGDAAAGDSTEGDAAVEDATEGITVDGDTGDATANDTAEGVATLGATAEDTALEAAADDPLALTCTATAIGNRIVTVTVKLNMASPDASLYDGKALTSFLEKNEGDKFEPERHTVNVPMDTETHSWTVSYHASGWDTQTYCQFFLGQIGDQNLDFQYGTDFYTVAKDKTNVYVSSTGSDYDSAGDGTASFPFATMAHSYKALDSDGTIHVMSDLTVDAPLTIGRNITIVSDDNDENTTDENYTIYRGSTCTGGSLFNVDYDKLVLKNITIHGSAVWTGSVDSVLDRGVINSGASYDQPLIIVAANGTLLLDSGSYLERSAAKAGTAVAGVDCSGTLTISGGVIRDCYAYGTELATEGSSASAVLVRSGGDFNFLSGSITGNSGRNVAGTVTLVGGDSSSLSMSGGSISNNRCDGSGGSAGIQLGSTTFLMTNGSITGNVGGTGTGTTSGGIASGSGVLCLGTGGNAIRILGNKCNGVTNNLYVGQDGYVTIESALNTSSRIGVRSQTAPAEGSNVSVAQGTGSYSVAAADANCFLSDTPATAGVVFEGGATPKVALSTTTFGEARLIKADGTVVARGSVSELMGNASFVSGATLEVLSEAITTAVTNGVVPNGATIKTYTGDVFQASSADNATIDVAVDGTVTLKSGAFACAAGSTANVSDGTATHVISEVLAGAANSLPVSYSVTAGASGTVGPLAESATLKIDGIVYVPFAADQSFSIKGGLDNVTSGMAIIPAGTALTVSIKPGLSVSAPSTNMKGVIAAKLSEASDYSCAALAYGSGDSFAINGVTFEAVQDHTAVGKSANGEALVLMSGAVSMGKDESVNVAMGAKTVKNTSTGTEKVVVSTVSGSSRSVTVTVPNTGTVSIGGMEYSNQAATGNLIMGVTKSGVVSLKNGAVNVAPNNSLNAGDVQFTNLSAANSILLTHTYEEGPSVLTLDAGDKVSIAGTEYAAASDATSIEVSNDGSTVKLTSRSVDLAPGESILLPDSTLIENTGTSTIQVGSDGAISILEKGAVSIDSKVYANVYEGTPLKLQVDEAADTVFLTSGIVVLSPSAVVLAIGNTFANSSTDPTLQVFVMMAPPDSKAVFMRVPENTTATVNGMAFTGLEDGGAMLIVSPTGDFLLWVGNTTLAPGASVGISSGQTVTNPAGSGQTLEVRADTPENGMTTVHVPAGASVVVAGQTYTAPDDASIDVVIGEDGTVTVTVNRAPAENATGTLPNTGDTTGGVWVFILLACLALACVVVSKNESNDRIN